MSCAKWLNRSICRLGFGGPKQAHVQLYSPGGANVPSHEVHNQTANRPVQPFWHSLRTAESLYRAPLSAKIALTHCGSGPHLTHDSLGPCEPKTQRARRSIQLFAQLTATCPYTIQWFARFFFKIALSIRGFGPHVIHGSLGPSESSTQTASRSLQPFLHGPLVWLTVRPTDRLTDHATRSVRMGRMYIRSTAMRRNNASHTWDTAKPYSRFMLLQTISPLLRIYVAIWTFKT